jgi:hypothetical protein
MTVSILLHLFRFGHLPAHINTFEHKVNNATKLYATPSQATQRRLQSVLDKIRSHATKNTYAGPSNSARSSVVTRRPIKPPAPKTSTASRRIPQVRGTLKQPMTLYQKSIQTHGKQSVKPVLSNTLHLVPGGLVDSATHKALSSGLTIPLAAGSRYSSSKPRISARSGGGIVIKHRELVRDVYGSTAYTVTGMVLNPGSPFFSPVTFGLSGLFMNYKVRSCTWDFRTSAPATESGNVGLFITPDPIDSPPTFSRSADMQFAKTTVSYDKDLRIHASPSVDKKVAGVAPFIVRKSDDTPILVSQFDPDKDFGVIWVFTRGQNTLDDAILGQLYVEYEIELYNFDTTDVDKVYNNTLEIVRVGTNIKTDPLVGGTYTTSTSVGGLYETAKVTIIEDESGVNGLQISIPNAGSAGNMKYLLYVKIGGTGLSLTIPDVYTNIAGTDGYVIGTVDVVDSVISTTTFVYNSLLDSSTSPTGYFGTLYIDASAATTVTSVLIRIAPYSEEVADVEDATSLSGRFKIGPVYEIESSHAIGGSYQTGGLVPYVASPSAGSHDSEPHFLPAYAKDPKMEPLSPSHPPSLDVRTPQPQVTVGSSSPIPPVTSDDEDYVASLAKFGGSTLLALAKDSVPPPSAPKFISKTTGKPVSH